MGQMVCPPDTWLNHQEFCSKLCDVVDVHLASSPNIDLIPWNGLLKPLFDEFSVPSCGGDDMNFGKYIYYVERDTSLFPKRIRRRMMRVAGGNQNHLTTEEVVKKLTGDACFVGKGRTVLYLIVL